MTNVVRWPPRPPQWCPPQDQCDCDTPSSLDRLQQCWNDTRQFKAFIQSVVESVMQGGVNGPTNPGPSPPSNPAAGTLWFDSATGQLMVYNGTNWVSVAAAAPGVTDGSDAQAGQIGEYVFSSTDDFPAGAGAIINNSTVAGWYPLVAAQIQLSPGDWDIVGQCNIATPPDSISYEMRAFLTTAPPPATLAAGTQLPTQFGLTELNFNYFGTGVTNAGFSRSALQMAPHRQNITVPTTVYFSAVVNVIPWATGGSIWGWVAARRMR